MPALKIIPFPDEICQLDIFFFFIAHYTQCHITEAVATPHPLAFCLSVTACWRNRKLRKRKQRKASACDRVDRAVPHVPSLQQEKRNVSITPVVRESVD